MRLAKNAAFNLCANLALALSNWLLLIVVSKFHGDHALGEVVLALSILSPLFLFASFKLRTLVICDTDNEYPVEQYFHARFIANSLILLCLPLVNLLLSEGISWQVMLIIGLYKWCDSWFELSISLRHRQQAFASASSWLLLRATVTGMVLVLSAFLGLPLLGMMLLWLLVTALFALAATLKSHKVVTEELKQSFSLLSAIFSRQRLFGALGLYRRYLTLSLALMCSSLFVYLPNLVIEHHLQIVDAGRFAATSYFLVAGSLLITSLSQAAQPKLRQLYTQQTFNKFWSLVAKLCMAGLFLGLMGVALSWLLGDWLLSLFYSQAMAAMHNEFIWIMAAAMIRYGYIFIGTGLNALKAFHIQTFIALAGTATVFIACLLWVPQAGTLGAAKAMFTATALEFMLYLAFLFLRRKQLGLGVTA
ncbi:hypothetical protein P2G88_16165 [Aliiglaciecola sp. CAU 1673]|uniref:lipopolysaccharide biosynthesis protein n=1 Tax=Aliiglaciecola sp. CAU 1673 TaxID=3032595 RepID=UPI0023DCDA2C|nr:hypothetical protein [Aliiglaciecola sp. CAU 1673]MDF2179787.1 hypothetical protein [Aliiglaciecola sp. CAU 1673]